MTRMTREDMFMAMAAVVKQRSTCARLHVGCVVTDSAGSTVVSMGYNGNAAGLPNACDSDEPGKCGCIHAEANALIKAPYNEVPLHLYTTSSPCVHCAKLILNSRVQHVYYAAMYRDETGLSVLRQGNMSVTHIPALQETAKPATAQLPQHLALADEIADHVQWQRDHKYLSWKIDAGLVTAALAALRGETPSVVPPAKGVAIQGMIGQFIGLSPE